MDEIKDLHKPFKEYLKKRKIKYSYKNWNNNKREGDEGIPDFVCFLKHGIVVNIEFKTVEKYNTKLWGLREKQVEWMDYLTSNNHKYLLTFSFEEAIKFVEMYMRYKEGDFIGFCK